MRSGERSSSSGDYTSSLIWLGCVTEDRRSSNLPLVSLGERATTGSNAG